jgi:hypothetical protein
MNREKLIRADTETTIAESAGKCAQIGNVVFQAIDKDEIVAAAIHLGKANFHLKLYLGFAFLPELLDLELLNNVFIVTPPVSPRH